ncbi:MAG TPA: tetratricopeptide repeat protein, partial [Candidatus Hydrogenedentes bacterium]|nr:tetratricopeptide repeat protein [Candidatus Hydrogenedentota bacterium]
MSDDLWELEQYCEEHLTDYEQRWRLAKRLYQEKDYRRALEHLQILTKEWTPRVNIIRYLAATQYRLKRYSEAMVVLEKAIEVWPEEVALREQYARVLETAERRLTAIKVWEEIRTLVPNHPHAEHAIARLKNVHEAPKPEGEPHDAQDSILAQTSTQACPQCGAQNYAALDRCWKCGASLIEAAGTSDFAAPLVAAASDVWRPAPMAAGPSFVWPAVAGVLSLALLAAGAVVTRQHLSFVEEYLSGSVYARAGRVIAAELTPAHLALGVVMVVVWPTVLLAAQILIGGRVRPVLHALVSGIFLAALAYALSWLPMRLLIPALLLTMAGALPIVKFGMNLPAGRALGVWFVHMVLVALC